MNFTTLAKERYSCRKISSRPIESEKLEAIKQAAIVAPTAHNFQPLKVWLIQTLEALEKIKSVTQQKFLHTSPACFIVGSNAGQGWVREEDSMKLCGCRCKYCCNTYHACNPRSRSCLYLDWKLPTRKD